MKKNDLVVLLNPEGSWGERVSKKLNGEIGIIKRADTLGLFKVLHIGISLCNHRKLVNPKVYNICPFDMIKIGAL